MKRIKDINKIYELLNEFDSSFFLPMKKMNIDAMVWADKIAKHGIVYVHEDSQINVGLLIFYANDEKENTSFLSYIVVKEGYQGHQLGGKMIKFWLNQAKRLGCKYCCLEVDKKNKRAIQFYKKHGFEIEESESDMSWFMRKKV